MIVELDRGGPGLPAARRLRQRPAGQGLDLPRLVQRPVLHGLRGHRRDVPPAVLHRDPARARAGGRRPRGLPPPARRARRAACHGLRRRTTVTGTPFSAALPLTSRRSGSVRSLIETPGDRRGVREPGALDLVPVAVGERDDARHHVVGAADLDLDRADPRGDPDDGAGLQAARRQVVGVHQQVVARPALGEPAGVVQPGVAVLLVPPADEQQLAVLGCRGRLGGRPEPGRGRRRPGRARGRSACRWSAAARASSGAAGRGRRPRGACAAPSSSSGRRS